MGFIDEIKRIGTVNVSEFPTFIPPTGETIIIGGGTSPKGFRILGAQSSPTSITKSIESITKSPTIPQNIAGIGIGGLIIGAIILYFLFKRK